MTEENSTDLSQEEKFLIMQAYGLKKGSIHVRPRAGHKYVYWVHHDGGPQWESLGRVEKVLDYVNKWVQQEKPVDKASNTGKSRVGNILVFIAGMIFGAFLIVLYWCLRKRLSDSDQPTILKA